MAHDTELWLEALAFDRKYGEDGPDEVERRIQRHLTSGESAEADRWIGIAARLEQLYRSHAQPVH